MSNKRVSLILDIIYSTVLTIIREKNTCSAYLPQLERSPGVLLFLSLFHFAEISTWFPEPENTSNSFLLFNLFPSWSFYRKVSPSRFSLFYIRNSVDQTLSSVKSLILYRVLPVGVIMRVFRLQNAVNIWIIVTFSCEKCPFSTSTNLNFSQQF